MIWINRIAKYVRRMTQCSQGICWRMKYDSGENFDIGSAGTCQDCGERTEAIEWPRMPDVKLPKPEPFSLNPSVPASGTVINEIMEDGQED